MKIVTSLSFNGQCREAFEFYAKVLGGKISAAFPYGDGPPGMPVDPAKKDWLMHCCGRRRPVDHGGRPTSPRSRTSTSQRTSPT